MTLPHPRAITSSLIAAALLSLVLVGSASAQVATLAEPDEDPEASAPPLAEELDGEEALLEFASCMRDNGIEMDDPRLGAGGGRFGPGPGPGDDADLAFDPRSSEFQAAMEICSGWLEALRPEVDAAQQAELAEQQLVLAECMRDLGWDFPDPAGGGGFGARVGFLEDGEIDPRDPRFQEDITTCQSESGLGFGPPGAEGA